MVRTERLLSAAIAALVVTTPAIAQGNGVPTLTPVTVPVASQSVTLQQAIEMSRRSAPAVIAAQGSIDAAEMSTRNARFSFFPQLTVTPQMSLNLSNGQSRLDPITQEIISGNQTSPTYSFGASAQWTIFDGFQRNFTLKSRRANEAVANATLVTSQFNADLNVTNAFFAALAQRQQVAVAQANVDQTAAQLRFASAKLSAGSGVLSDSLSALGNYLQAQFQLLQAKATLVTNESNLGRLVGSATQVSAVDDSSYYRPPASIDTAAIRQEVMTTAPAIVSLQASLDAAQQSWKASKASYYPTLSATGAQSWTGFWTSPSPPTSQSGLTPHRSLSINLSVSPWTNFTRETQIANNAIAITNAEINLADARNQIAAQLNAAYASLATDVQQITVTGAAVTAGNENVRVTTERYRLGVATITDVLTAQNQLVQAQTSQLQARFSYLTAKAALEALIGRKL